MKKEITQPVPTLPVSKKREQVSPKDSTLDLLKQFARSYHFEARLTTDLGNFLAN